MGNITFTISAGGLGRPLAGEDHYSSLVTYIPNADLPAGFSTSDRIKTIYSPNDATALGIVSTSTVDGIKVLRYNIDELFRMNKKAIVYVAIYDNTSIDYTVCETVQNKAKGKIRQFGVITHATNFATGTVTSLNTSFANMDSEGKPAICVLGSNLSGIALASLSDLRALGKKYVSCVCGQDGANEGAALATSLSKSVPNVGAVIGAISAAKVNESIAWIEKFDFLTTTEMSEPAFGNGALVSAQTASLLDQINTKGWVFFHQPVGTSGTYVYQANNCDTATSDFARIYSMRVIQKAVRGVRVYVTPDLSSPLYINTDGTLTEETIAHFKNKASQALEQMQREGEISAFKVIVNPQQDVLSTSTLNIGIEIIQVGVAESISVNIGFVTALL